MPFFVDLIGLGALGHRPAFLVLVTPLAPEWISSSGSHNAVSINHRAKFQPESAGLFSRFDLALGL